MGVGTFGEYIYISPTLIIYQEEMHDYSKHVCAWCMANAYLIFIEFLYGSIYPGRRKILENIYLVL